MEPAFQVEAVMSIRSTIWFALLLTAVSAAPAAPPLQQLPPGDGIGTVTSYDPMRKMITVDSYPVLLTQAAAASLESQLRTYSLSGVGSFGVKFAVVRDAAGTSMVESIVVLPPKSIGR
jgi:hypothetical protein